MNKGGRRTTDGPSISSKKKKWLTQRAAGPSLIRKTNEKK